MTSPSSETVNVIENSTQIFICQTDWGEPAATVTWFKSLEASDAAITIGITHVESNKNGTIQVTSTLRYTATRADTNYTVFCKATNGGVVTQSVKKPLLAIMYPPPNGPVKEGLPGADVYNMIRGSSTQQHLKCSVTGGYPLPTLSWNCYGGAQNGSTQGNTVTSTVYWVAGVNVDSNCTCTAQQSGTGWARTMSAPVNVLYTPSSPNCTVGSAWLTTGNIRVIKGRTLTIACSTSANPLPTYTWTLPSGGTHSNNSLSVPNVNTEGTYRLSVRNTMEPTRGDIEMGIGYTTFNIEILASPSEPVFYYGISPSGSAIPSNNLDVIKGTRFSVTCFATGNPAPTMTWDGSNQTWSAIAQYNLSKTCSVVNILNPTGYSQEQGTSQETKLTVGVLFPPAVIECTVGSARFTSAPVYVKRDSTFIIRCNSTSFPAPYNYTWTLPNGETRVGPELSVQNIHSVQSNQYQVTVSNIMVPSFGEVTIGTYSTSLDIQLLYPPHIQSGIHIQGDSSTFSVNDSYISTVENSTFTLSFNVTPGYPSATQYTWSRRIGNTQSSTRAKTVINIKRNDADSYIFNAFNRMNPTGFGEETGTASHNVYINVKYRSVITTFYAHAALGDVIVKAPEGTTFKLTCVTDSNPLPKITLTKNGATVQEITSVKQMEYNKPNISCENDMGEYTCLSKNELNPSPDMRTLHLYVLCKPRLSSFAQNASYITGSLRSSANLSITVVAYPTPNYTWQKMSESGWTMLVPSARMSIVTSADHLQSNVSISDIQEADFGSYRVVSNNSEGEISIVLYFQVAFRPKIPRYFHYTQSLHPEASATFYWLAGYNGGYIQTFYIEYKQIESQRWDQVTVVEDKHEQLMNITVGNLRPETEYQARIYAINKIGSSDISDSINFTTLGTIATQKSVSNIGLIIAGIVPGCILVGVIAILIYMRLTYRIHLTKKCNETHAALYDDVSSRNEITNREFKDRL
ncbi:hemicentin-2-like [Dreissena polymorpha]|uniref:hemicentin-2-like n=1 Tax=Dreissena polymorpha TaxID=45954 RepID=UPI0022651E5E|nr:hemicentin-2-like [Dreissena polymorpha]